VREGIDLQKQFSGLMAARSPCFRREEFLIEMLIELSLVDGQHVRVFSSTDCISTCRAAQMPETFLSAEAVKLADQFFVPVVHFGMQDDRNILRYQ